MNIRSWCFILALTIRPVWTQQWTSGKKLLKYAGSAICSASSIAPTRDSHQ